MGSKSFGKGYYEGYNKAKKNKMLTNIASAVAGFLFATVAILLNNKRK